MRLTRLVTVISFLLLFSCHKSVSPPGGGGTVNNPVPVLSAINPVSTLAGSSSFILTVTGSNFVRGSVINWNSSTLPTNYVSSTQLTATVPATNVAIAGTAAITVVSPSPGGGTSNTLTFIINSSGNPAPSLISISPGNATAGDPSFTITATGTNFISSSVINWDGTALTTTFVSTTQLTAVVPASDIAAAGTASITIVSPAPGGGISNALPFTINASNPSPALTSISPSNTTAGALSFTITATGTNFISSSIINWNGSPLTTTYVSPTQLTANVPSASVATPGSASVTVISPTPGGGTSNTLTFTINASGNPAPSLTSISPVSTTAGGASFTITATGSNFISSSTINWNGTTLTTNYVSASQLTAVVPAAQISTAGTASVTVFTPAPGGGTSNALTFTINPANNPVPALTSLSPSSTTSGGTSFTLTVNGTNFISASTIQWNGTTLTTNYVSTSQLTAVVQASSIASAGTASVTVFSPTPGGGTSNALTFTINPANNPVPALTSLSPSSTTAGGASFTLIVNGTNFISASTIKWDGTTLTTNYVSASQLTAVIAAASTATAGTASVTVFSPAPGGGTSNALTFTINSAPPAVKKFLFDATHAETAGNADWVIDEDGGVPQRIPTPAQSTVTAGTPETYWTGAISSWGIDLAKQGYTVETLPSGTAITFGNGTNVQDLSNYDVFIVDEPNKVFTASEKTAILNFVNQGGGLLMVSDHTISDRDGDGWDSPDIWNDLMTNNTVQNNPFGFSINLANFSEITSNILTNSSSSTVLTGSQGNVTQIEFNNGTTATINPASNPNVKGLIWKTGTAQNNNNIMSLSSVYGSGRVFFLGDSSPVDDGTGYPGNVLFTGWTSYSHRNLLMNASLWLSKVQ